MKWFVKGDIDGFLGLALDNLVQLLVIAALCGGLLGMPAAIVYGHILPGAAVSLIVGNLFYAWQARRLAARLDRTDICALPYGINTPSVFLFIFLVMAPARQAMLGTGAGEDEAALHAWRIGLLACLGSGVIEFGGAFVAGWIRRSTPRPAMLATLAGIAVGFISMPFIFRAFGNPLLAFVPLVVIFVAYFGKVKFRGGLPGGLVAVLLGAGLSWIPGIAPDRGDLAAVPGFYLPLAVFGDLLAALDMPREQLGSFLSVVIAMGLFNVLGSLQNVESAAAAGDEFDTRSSLAVNGAGTVVASLFGSCFPTTIYIGHPGWKGMGARAGYSVLNAIFCTIICLTGTVAVIAWAVPIEAVMAVVVWIALVITAQSFQVTPRVQFPAVVVGLLPGIAAWGVLMAEAGMRAGGLPPLFEPGKLTAIVDAFGREDIDIRGAFALEQGALFTAMIFAAMTVYIIEQRFVLAAVWCLVAALLSLTGLMHSYQAGYGEVVLALGPAWNWVWGYLAMGAVLALVPVVSKPPAIPEIEDESGAQPILPGPDPEEA